MAQFGAVPRNISQRENVPGHLKLEAEGLVLTSEQMIFDVSVGQFRCLYVPVINVEENYQDIY